ncbi:D-lyxose/D-mannose family sugar isomerase [Sulfitobacter sp. 20_GPM-1509m]|uniref:D-lyxose/D-mannose family sugar isomerase n=1 Tax=Sulfitobacter sp. 20_GPM-1509m TaxID=1380367 RepID=UPI00048F9F77|nr:D-lyxose/D-mannose family sugar isomerase [Sulfitobacter sp. 20_GPM-1509m]
MKRSEINTLLEDARAFFERHGFSLPPFAQWSPAEFAARQESAAHLIRSRCGWDVTDYGAGRFDEMGLVLFTLRNGLLSDLNAGRGMCYAEKLLITRRDQLSPMHTHRVKAEDIINRAGGTLVVELFGSDAAGRLDPQGGGAVICDGLVVPFKAGDKLRLAPGESITLRPGDWHAFWAEEADVLIGEVSTVNDDETDNIFNEPITRFSQIEEDVNPAHLLVSDYPAHLI